MGLRAYHAMAMSRSINKATPPADAKKSRRVPDAEVKASSHPTVKHFASVYPGRERELPPKFARLILDLEAELKMPVWMVIQNRSPKEWSGIDPPLLAAVIAARQGISAEKIAMLIQTPGGDATIAYKVARTFQRRTKHFKTVVPLSAMSAGTLIALAGDSVLMATDAELGPLDVQLLDPEREDIGSALDAVQALERLHAFSLAAVDKSMLALLPRTRKRIDTLLPLVLNYSAALVRPLLEKIDTVDFTKKSRSLKVAEQYAIRLMEDAGYSQADAKNVATTLVENYPTHGFSIDRDEAKRVGIKVEVPSDNVERIFEGLVPFLYSLTVIGRLESHQ
jgi:hypothetical protein